MLQVVSDPFLAFAKGRWDYTYYFGYWATVVATTALTIVVFYEVIQHVWPLADAGRKLGAVLVWLVLALVIGQSVIVLATSTGHSSGPDSITSLILMADRGLRIVVCGLGLFILMFRKWLGLSRRELSVGIVAGFVLFSVIHILVATAVSHQTVLHRSTLSAINSGAYLLAALIWFRYAMTSRNVTLGDSAGSTPSRPSWPGGPGYALRATEPWWSKLKLRGFSIG
jgi:hypothetical protein